MILWKGILAPDEWWRARTLAELMEIEEAYDAKEEESRDNPEAPHSVPSRGEAADGSDREGYEVRALCPDYDPEVKEAFDGWILEVTPLPR